MAANQRAIVYFPQKLYRALKARAAMTNRRLSDLVTEAVQLFLKEDTVDEDAVRRRRKEPSRVFGGFAGAET